MWKISAILVVSLATVSGAFKLYYDKAEAEKEAIATQLRQSADNNLKIKFDKHNMNVLSLRKPKLIENIINRGTREVLSELEAITNPTINNM